MSINLPLRSSSSFSSARNQASRNYFTNHTQASTTSLETASGTLREAARDLIAPVNDRLIVGVDFGTTFSG